MSAAQTRFLVALGIAFVLLLVAGAAIWFTRPLLTPGMRYADYAVRRDAHATLVYWAAGNWFALCLYASIVYRQQVGRERFKNERPPKASNR